MQGFSILFVAIAHTRPVKLADDERLPIGKFSLRREYTALNRMG